MILDWTLTNAYCKLTRQHHWLIVHTIVECCSTYCALIASLGFDWWVKILKCNTSPLCWGQCKSHQIAFQVVCCSEKVQSVSECPCFEILCLSFLFRRSNVKKVFFGRLIFFIFACNHYLIQNTTAAWYRSTWQKAFVTAVRPSESYQGSIFESLTQRLCCWQWVAGTVPGQPWYATGHVGWEFLESPWLVPFKKLGPRYELFVKETETMVQKTKARNSNCELETRKIVATSEKEESNKYRTWNVQTNAMIDCSSFIPAVTSWLICFFTCLLAASPAHNACCAKSK